MCSRWNMHPKWAIEKVTKCFMSLPRTKRGRRNLLHITSMSGTFIGRLWMHHLRKRSMRMKICKGSLGEFFCVGLQPLTTSLDAIYFKSSPKWPLLAHYSGFHHVGYKRGPCPPPHYNDKHEQVRFILNTIDFKVPVLSCFQSTSFQFLTLCIEVEIFFQICFNPPSLSNLITSKQVWCITFSMPKASGWFHWSNSRMSLILMFTRNVKTSPKRCGTLWCKKVFWTICIKFDSC